VAHGFLEDDGGLETHGDVSPCFGGFGHVRPEGLHHAEEVLFDLGAHGGERAEVVGGLEDGDAVGYVLLPGEVQVVGYEGVHVIEHAEEVVVCGFEVDVPSAIEVVGDLEVVLLLDCLVMGEYLLHLCKQTSSYDHIILIKIAGSSFQIW